MQDWYAAALREAWRDQAHEDEVLALGQVLQDLRQA
jgi:molybdopterin converting factor small subunit